MSKAIRFRKMRGRIIPIRERRGEAVLGSGQVVAGAGTSAATGVVAAGMVKKAAKLTDESRREYKVGTAIMRHFTRGQMSLEQSGTIAKGYRTIKHAVNKRIAAKGIFRSRNAVLVGGSLAAAGLAGRGLTHLRVAATGREANGGQIRDQAVGAAAAAGAYGAYYRRLGVKDMASLYRNVKAKFQSTKGPIQTIFRGI